MMALSTIQITLWVVDFLDGPTLLMWKAIGRSCDCYETNVQIGRWLFKRAKCMDSLAKFFLDESPELWPDWLRERSLSLSHDEASDSEL